MILHRLAAAWLAGVVAGAFDWNPGIPLAAVLVGALIALLRPPAGQRPLLAALALICAAAGWAHAVQALPAETPAGVAQFTGSSARVRGVITNVPVRREVTVQAAVEVHEILVEGTWQPMTGKVLITSRPYPVVAYGDLLELQGTLQEPPIVGAFDYREYLARQGIHSVMYYPRVLVLGRGQGAPWRSALFAVRDRLSAAIGRTLPEPQASLASGIVFGGQGAFPPALREAFNRTGTAHIVAVSGANLMIFTGLLCALLAPNIGRRRAALVAAPLVLLYMLLVGAPVSAVRAAIMALLYLGAVLSGRPATGLANLALAATFMTALDPRLPRDVAFQLSVAATAGLLTYGEILRRVANHLLFHYGGEALRASGLVRSVIQAVTTTLAAILATEPLIALHFQRLSLVALPANLIVVPLVSPVMVICALLAAAGGVNSVLGSLLGWLAWPFLTAILFTVQSLAAFPFAAVTFPGIGLQHVLAFYTLGAGVLWSIRHLSRWPSSTGANPRVRLHLRPGVPALVSLTAAAVGVWGIILLMGPSGRLTVIALDVGQGDALLIQAPSGHRILVDGGPSGDRLLRALGREIPFWDRRIDMVILTHPEADHVTGLITVLDRYRTRQVVTGPAGSSSPAAQAWQEALDRHRLTPHIAAPGEWIDLGGGAALRILGPAVVSQDVRGSTNDNSLVIRLERGTVSFLLAADIERAGEQALLESRVPLRSTVLKVAHHGAATSTTAPFLRAVRPAVAIISAGAGNPYGHPSPETIGRLRRTLILRTDEHGAVRLTTDGQKLWLHADRLPSAPR